MNPSESDKPRSQPGAALRQHICAVVVTFNRLELLARALRALARQTRPPDTVLVVDNACTDGTHELLEREFPAVEILRLPVNCGGAGGFAAGIEWALERGFDWLWIMDDDGCPEATALEALLRAEVPADVLVPLQRDSHGRLYGAGIWNGRYCNAVTGALGSDPLRVDMFAFVGPLVSASTVRKVGLPRRDFFIWFDDSEYALRLRQAGARVFLVPQSTIDHDCGGATRSIRFFGVARTGFQQPPWKTYYITRNYIYCMTRLYPAVKNLFWTAAVITRGFLRDCAIEDQRLKRLGFRVQGVLDGIAGRMGRKHD